MAEHVTPATEEYEYRDGQLIFARIRYRVSDCLVSAVSGTTAPAEVQGKSSSVAVAEANAEAVATAYPNR